MTAVTVILAILAFGFLVIAHELGHFMAARASGVRVNEFWVGMGPAILHRRVGETEFKLCILPFGGACVMEGEDEETEAPDCFTKASPWHRIVILAAGAFMNFIVGALIVMILVFPVHQTVVPVLESVEPEVTEAQPDGLRAGDRILRIDGYHVYQSSDVTLALSLGRDDSFDIVVRRDGEKVRLNEVSLPLRHFAGDEEDRVRYGLNFELADLTVGGRLREVFFTSYNYVRMVWVSLRELVTGGVGVKDLSGPVGVATVMAETAKSNLLSFFMLVAFISINLGVMNLLPLPALDGGRLLFVFVELILGHPVNRKYEGYIHAVGMVLLMVLMVYITGQDILKLIVG